MKYNFLLALLILGLNSFSQNIRLEGNVKDEKGIPIEMANIVAINQTTKVMDGYAISNEKGNFNIYLKQNTTYSIKVNFIGYGAFETILETKSVNTNLLVILKEGILLNEVEIVREMPVTISGDTISYKSDAFSNGTERKLEDVLKKLPGVEVTKDGEIQVEGKTVQKIMVEGKDFFDGDTKIASKNIPADALDKIQVLRNYNEVSNLKGVTNNEENIAINIKLKEGKKNFWFGDVNAGTGVADDEARYVVNPKLFYYSPKYSVNVIANLNNIGEIPMTAQDYFRFSGGFRNLTGRSGSNFNVSSNDLGIAGLQNNQAANIETNFGAANFSCNPTKEWTISGFSIFSKTLTDLETNTISNRIDELPDGTTQTITEISEDKTFQTTNQALVKFSSSYIPSTKLHLDYDVFFKYSKQDENTNLFSNLLDDIQTEKIQNPFSINQNINLYYTHNEKNVFAFELQYLYQEDDPFYNANLQTQPFELDGYITSQLRNDLTQERFIRTNKLDAKLDYYYTVTPKSIFNITLGNTYSYQNYNSSMFQRLDDATINNLTATENNNNVDFTFYNAFAGFHYRFLIKKFTFNPGFNVHSYRLIDNQIQTTNSKTFHAILPDINILFQIKKSETLSYNFSASNAFTDINRLSVGNIFSNYNSLITGNRNLENATSLVHSIRYFKYNMFNYENIFANVSYSRQTEAIKNQTEFNGVNQVSTSVNIDPNFADETFSASGNYGRSFLKYYKANFSSRISWNKFNNIRVFQDSASPGNTINQVQTTESFNQSYTIGFSTNFKRLPSLSLSYNYSINDNFSDIIYTDSPTISLEYGLDNGFSFTSEYNYFHNKNKSETINTEYDFLSMNIMYRKKDSKWEWKLSGTNLLNTTALETNSFNQLGGTSTFSSYRVQPRFIILNLRYNI